MVMLVNLSTFALNANVILFDEKDLNNSQNLKVPYHAFASVAHVAASQGVTKIIIQGTPEYCEDYKDSLYEELNRNFKSHGIKIVID